MVFSLFFHMPKCFQSRFRSKQRGLVPEFQVIFTVLGLFLVAFPFLSFWCLDMAAALYWKGAGRTNRSRACKTNSGYHRVLCSICPLNLLHIFHKLSSYLWMTKHLRKSAYVSQGRQRYCPKWGKSLSSNTCHTAVIRQKGSQVWLTWGALWRVQISRLPPESQ